MQVSPSSLPTDSASRSAGRFAAQALENCDTVALKVDDLGRRVEKQSGRRRNCAVLRTQTALKQTESVLAQTAHSLQRTAGVLKPAVP